MLVPDESPIPLGEDRDDGGVAIGGRQLFWIKAMFSLESVGQIR